MDSISERWSLYLPKTQVCSQKGNAKNKYIHKYYIKNIELPSPETTNKCKKLKHLSYFPAGGKSISLFYWCDYWPSMRTVSHITCNFESHLKALPWKKRQKYWHPHQHFGINKRKKANSWLKPQRNYIILQRAAKQLEENLQLPRDF